MGYAPFIVSLLFFSVFSLYLFFGIYIINLNSKARLNLIFMVACLSLCLWSFGFSIANSAPNQEACLFWRRVSALGWTSIHSILLHFLLVLTGKGNVLRGRWFYGLLYLPALVAMYVFSLSNPMAAHQYNLVKMNYGWVNVAVNNGWDVFFYVYYAGYGLACLGLIWLWWGQSSDETIRRQAKLLFSSFLAALLLGSLTDIILSSYLTHPLPQMAPVVTLIPIMVIYYSIKRYGLMHQEKINKDELILNDETRTIVFYYLAKAFLAAGLLAFLSEYLPHMLRGTGEIHSAFLSGGLLFGIGFALQMIQGLKSEDLKNTLNMAVLLSGIPLITLGFLDNAGLTVWAFPMILVIVSLVFNKRTLLLSVTVIAVLTQIMIWTIKPQITVQVDEFDYILRIGIFIVAFWIGLHVNKIYVAKLKENAYQTSFQKIISEISFEFVSVNTANFDEKIRHLLDTMGCFFQTDRTCVFLFDYEKNTMTYTHGWCSLGIDPEKGVEEEIPFSAFSWWLGQLTHNKLICIEDVGKMPAEAGAEKEYFIRQKVKSLVAIPIEGTETIQGFLAINAIASRRKWSEDQIKLLKILANVLADGLIKIKAEKEIQFMAFYDHLTGLPNRTLFADRLNQAIYLAKRSGRFVGVVFIDLDGFKTVNDTLGHSGGDVLIKEVAQGLKKRLRESDTVARYGGDEFLIMVSDIPDYTDIEGIVNNIMRLFEGPFTVLGQELFITGSAGVAVYPMDGEDAETLTRNADMAMYEAKSRGKNQSVLYSSKNQWRRE